MSKRVVGKPGETESPGCHDILFGLAWIANVVFIVAAFFAWLGNDAPGFPEQSIEDLANAAITNTTLERIGSVTALTGLYAFIFSTVWSFLFLGIMWCAAYALIIGMNLLLILIWFGAGALLLFHSTICKDRGLTELPVVGKVMTGFPGPCSDTEQSAAVACGVILMAIGALHLLWLCCIRSRIAFTAKMLSSVSSVLAKCPGTIIISLIFAIITLFWYACWGGAFLQSTIWLRGSEHAEDASTTDLAGSYVGLLFGMLVSLFWGHKVFVNIAQITSCHVIASWYFHPESAEEGVASPRTLAMIL